MMAECDYRDLDKCCLPEENSDVNWFDSFDELKEGKFDPSEATYNTIRRATRQY